MRARTTQGYPHRLDAIASEAIAMCSYLQGAWVGRRSLFWSLHGLPCWCILCSPRAYRKPCYHRTTTPRGRRSVPDPHAAPGCPYPGHLNEFAARATDPDDVFDRRMVCRAQPAEPRQCESFASGRPRALPVLLGSFSRRGLPRLLGKLPYLLEPLLELLGRVRAPKRPRQILQVLFVGTYENERLSERHVLEGRQR